LFSTGWFQERIQT